MKFYEKGVFHIYNQGNNKRPIFFQDDHYEFFLWKMRSFLPPFADIISWCLMPNHFHWQLQINRTYIPRNEFRMYKDSVEKVRRAQKYGEQALELRRPVDYYKPTERIVTLNQAIGRLLGSYALAVNKSMGWTGSVFKKKCKSKDGFIEMEDYEIKYNGQNGEHPPENWGYIKRCFEYIHENPVRGGIVRSPLEYPWSSAREYEGLDSFEICNVELGRELTGRTLPLSKVIT